jgi:hypothetical protein
VSKFIIRSASSGPADLIAGIPLRATTLRCLPDKNGQGEFWCARMEEPLKYRFDSEFDTARCQPEFLGRDDQGQFLWIQIVVVSARGNNRLRPGMRGLPADLAYVVDHTLGQDSVLDRTKIENVAVVHIDDDIGDHVEPPRTALQRLSVEDFNMQLLKLVATLATLTGHHPGLDQVPEPIESRRGRGRRVYDVRSDNLRYYTFDRATRQWRWHTTTDPDELLYWILEDVADILARAWAHKAPSFKTMDKPQALEVLWMPQWQSLMTALNVEWGKRTGERIESLRGRQNPPTPDE